MKEGVPSTAAIRPTTYLFGDHLGSSSLATNESGAVVAETRYKPYGEIRWSSGAMPTDFGYTGQRLEKAGYVGSLMDYKARAYSPALGRFVSADTIVPGAGSSQAFNRYMYVLGSPLGAIDPSGHSACNDFDDCERPGTKADLDQQTYTFPQFVRWPVGNSIGYGFGPIKNARNNDAYYYTSGLHGGVDLFAPAGTVVRAGVYGKYLGPNQVADANYNPANAVVLIGEYYIIYGHVLPDAKLKPGDSVTPDTVIGVVGEWKWANGGVEIRDPSNDHVHLAVLTRDGYVWTTYNSLLFALPELAQLLTINEASAYVKGESATSILSFRYTTTDYWTATPATRRETIGVEPWRDRVSPMWRARLLEEYR